MNYKSFGKQIQAARKSKNMTLDQLSELIDLSDKTLQSIESGKNSTRIDKLILLCNILEVSPEYLLSSDLSTNLNKTSSIYDNLYNKSLNLTPKRIIFVQDIIDMLISNRKKYRNNKF